jgi:hypothetical protein
LLRAGYYTTEEGVSYWGKMGAFWASLHGWWRAGTAFFVIPGIGPTLVAGPLVASIVSALEGALMVEGMSVIGAALYSSGVPKDSASRMETALKSDKFLVFFHGTASEVRDAGRLLGTTGAIAVHEYLAEAEECDNAA